MQAELIEESPLKGWLLNNNIGLDKTILALSRLVTYYEV